MKAERSKPEAGSRQQRGGRWLVDDVSPESIFTRERFSDEQRLIGQTAESFVDGEVTPVLDRREQ
jgi:hypothetical protein